MIRNSLTALMVTALTLNVACTKDDSKQIEEIVETTEQKPDEHAFEVDQQTGKVEFQAEIVYFAFDDASLTEEGMERLSALGDYLQENPHLEVSIEGHCDERGSPEYNLALGQRRSESVRQFLITYGLPKDRLRAISFGEEKPAVEGADESAWAQNRRAEFTLANLDGKEKNLKQTAKAEKAPAESAITTVSDDME